jgi:serine/threonine protein kinase
MVTSPIDAGDADPAAPSSALLAAEAGGRCRPCASRVVGDYALVRTLGEGAVGKVKLARHVVTGDLVALKIVRKALLQSKPALAMKVRREIAVLKLLGGAAGMEHAGRDVGVLKLFDVYETEQCWLMILEYCPRGDLFDELIQHGFLSSDDALAYFQQLVLALHFSHAQGITHRDLKLENLLIDAAGHLKLADFGMASLMTRGSLLETSCGSPAYCAPEVLSGELYDGALSDCWSLGVILYAMVTGGLPFDDDNFSRLLAKVRSGVFFVPDEVDADVADLIRALLRVDPEARLSLDGVMRTPWFASRPLPAHMASLHRTVPRPYAPMSASQDDPTGAAVPAAAAWVAPRSGGAAPIVDPAMPIVIHLTELGMGEIPTILRRLKSERNCIEKDFYHRIGAFVRQPSMPHPIAGEMPLSPNTDAVAMEAQRSPLALIPVGVLPASLAASSQIGDDAIAAV